MCKRTSIVILICMLAVLVVVLCACSDQQTACNHNLEKVSANDATCTVDGNIEYWQCSLCQKKFSDEAASKEISDVAIPASHKMSKIDAKAETCTESGLVEHWHCNVCNKNFVDENGADEAGNIVIPPSHKLTKVDGVEAGCTTNGTVEHWHCNACQRNFYDGNGITEIDEVTIAASHKFGDYMYDHTEKSYVRTCDICSESESVAAGTKQFPLLVGNETELADVVQHAKAGCFIQLANDIDITTGELEVITRIPNGGTLDLGGYTVTVKNNMGFVLEGSDVILQNGSFATDFPNPKSGYALFLGDEGDNNRVTLRNISTIGGINVYNCVATLYDCHVDASNHQYYALWADYHSTIIVESGVYQGGEIACVHSTAVNPSENEDEDGRGKFFINGGEFHGKIIATDLTVINGGSFDGQIAVTKSGSYQGKLIVSKDYVEELEIVCGTAACDMVASEDGEGNVVYVTVDKSA